MFEKGLVFSRKHRNKQLPNCFYLIFKTSPGGMHDLSNGNEIDLQDSKRVHHDSF